MTFVERICAGCKRPGGTVAFRYKLTRNGKLSEEREYYHPRCMRKKQNELALEAARVFTPAKRLG